MTDKPPVVAPLSIMAIDQLEDALMYARKVQALLEAVLEDMSTQLPKNVGGTEHLS